MGKLNLVNLMYTGQIAGQRKTTYNLRSENEQKDHGTEVRIDAKTIIY